MTFPSLDLHTLAVMADDSLESAGTVSDSPGAAARVWSFSERRPYRRNGGGIRGVFRDPRMI